MSFTTLRYRTCYLLLCSLSFAFGQNFYDEGNIQTIEVFMSQSNWDNVLDDAYANTGDYVMADSVVINGEVYDSVGVKYKGNSSYNSSQVKNPWHIELDTYKDHDHEGYKDIKLANLHKDPSFVRDVLGFHIARKYMDAPESNYANVFVNGTLIGLYTNTEAITKTFVKDRFGTKTHPFFSCSPPAGAGPTSQDLPNLVFLGSDSTAYYDAYEMKSDNGWKELIALCDTLQNASGSIENILDLDRALWMLAFDNAIVNLDSYIGQFAQNYYLYQDDFGRFLPIVWDLNESFGTFSQTGTGSLNSPQSKQELDPLLHSVNPDFPLVSQLLDNPRYKKMYLAHFKTILEENFTVNGVYFSAAQGFQSLIDASVQDDPNNAYSYNQFLSNLTSDVTSGGGGGPGPGGISIPGITSLMNARYNFLMSQIEFTTVQPDISSVSSSATLPTLGGTTTISASVSQADDVLLGVRDDHGAPFEYSTMYDDGNHNDGGANDGIYGAEISISSATTEYFIYAENSGAGRFSPARAQHEFYTLFVTGEIELGDIVINEFLASNDTTQEDQDGEYDDWIEIYNRGNAAVDISGYLLSDDISELDLFTFPSGTVLQPDSYLIVWADKDDTQSGLHGDFKLSASGETVFLTNANETIIDSVAFGAQITDQSFGRYPNGDGPFQFMPATFSSENTINPGLEVEEKAEPLEVLVYPNPASNFLMVEVPNIDAYGLQYTVFDSYGNVVLDGMLYSNQTELDVHQLKAGIYYLRVGNTVRKVMITL